MKRGSTIFLKIAVTLIGIPILALCILGLLWLPNNPASPDYDHLLYPAITGIYISAIPFFIALYQAFKLLNYIDINKAFSKGSVQSLKVIKFCAVAISSMYLLIMPFVFFIAELDDAPGLILAGMVPFFASSVIAVFAAVLQRLLQEAIDIKAENDLTV
jgi:hypothetical protein